jgi:hypothetical protein
MPAINAPKPGAARSPDDLTAVVAVVVAFYRCSPLYPGCTSKRICSTDVRTILILAGIQNLLITRSLRRIKFIQTGDTLSISQQNWTMRYCRSVQILCTTCTTRQCSAIQSTAIRYTESPGIARFASAPAVSQCLGDIWRVRWSALCNFKAAKDECEDNEIRSLGHFVISRLS